MSGSEQAAAATLEERVRRLEDVEKIERLMARYGECVDNGYDLVGMERLLTEDLRWESNAFGSYADREQYLEGQAAISEGVEWAFHVMVPITVEITDTGAARGTFYLLMLGTFLGSGADAREPIVLSARYDNRFVMETGGWRCNVMNVRFHQVSRLTEGWVREQFWAPEGDAAGAR